MKKLGKFKLNKIYCGNCQELTKDIPDNSIDLIVTDSPYQLDSIKKRWGKEGKNTMQFDKSPHHRTIRGFMGKEWDVLPPIEVWQECLRVLKSGAFAFIMTTPRQDSLSQILMDLTKAGFYMGFSSIYWTYASGFPKASNIGKMVDKRLGTVKYGETKKGAGKNPKGLKFDEQEQSGGHLKSEYKEQILTSPQAKSLNGSYGGFQPKPAVEIIIVAMKPLSEKTYIDQALKNKKGITWLDNCRIPYESKEDKESTIPFGDVSKTKIYGGTSYHKSKTINKFVEPPAKGRFPANLLVSNDVLNDGRITKSKASIRKNRKRNEQNIYGMGKGIPQCDLYSGADDEGSYSRYFDLDKWSVSKGVKDTFPFLIVPKASKSEKNKGLENLPLGEPPASGRSKPAKGRQLPLGKPRANFHPTVKPIKLMSYLIILGSRKGDIIFDPFIGSGTTAIACKLLNRRYLGFEINKEYVEIAKARVSAIKYVQDGML